MLDKKALRKEIGALKRAMTQAEIDAYSAELTEKFCNTPEYLNAASVYIYLPYNQEVRTWEIVKRAWADGKKVAVPKVYGDEMKFLWLENFDAIAPGGWDIPEPTFDEPIADDENALILMPGLAFDPEGHRVGYGGGFYDKYLEEHSQHKLVALCYPFQLFAHLDVEEHDIPVDRVICAAEKLRLIQPSTRYIQQIDDYRLAFLNAGDSMDGTGVLEDTKDTAQWLKQCEDFQLGQNLPNGWMPATQFICVRERDDKLVGMINVRHCLNPYLEKFGGHIGYSVRPDERGKGYSKWMLRAVLPHCRALHLKKLLITCDNTNTASRKCILACGGTYESTVSLENECIERYWIQL